MYVNERYVRCDLDIVSFYIVIALVYFVSVYAFLYHYVTLCSRIQKLDYEKDLNYVIVKKDMLNNYYYKTLFFIFLLTPSSANFILFFPLAPVYVSIVAVLIMIKDDWKESGKSFLFLCGTLFLTFLFFFFVGWIIQYAF